MRLVPAIPVLPLAWSSRPWSGERGLKRPLGTPPNFSTSREAVLAYVEAVFEDGDPELIALALNDAARVRNLVQDRLTAQSDIASVIRTLRGLGLALTVKSA